MDQYEKAILIQQCLVDLRRERFDLSSFTDKDLWAFLFRYRDYFLSMIGPGSPWQPTITELFHLIRKYDGSREEVVAMKMNGSRIEVIRARKVTRPAATVIIPSTRPPRSLKAL